MDARTVSALYVLVCSVTIAGCLGPVVDGSAPGGESPTATPSATSTERDLMPSTSGPCTLAVDEASEEEALAAAPASRRHVQNLTASDRAIFRGETDEHSVDQWNTSIRYVRDENQWYEVRLACP